MAPKTITIIGSLNTDLITTTPRVPSGGETLTATSFTTGSGGKGANQAVAVARLSRPRPASGQPAGQSDIKVRMLGSVGSDSFGPPLIQGLQDSGIDTSTIAVSSTHPTGVAVIIVESSSGENRILLSPGANHNLLSENFSITSSLGSPLPDLLILQLEIPLDTVLRILQTAKEANVAVLLNPAPAVTLPEKAFEAITHLILNETEAAILTNRTVSEVSNPSFSWTTITDEFLRLGVKNVVVTLGAKGAFFASVVNKRGVLIPAEKVEKVVDTTAAGDTFVGAYAVRVVGKMGKSGKGTFVVEDDIRYACRASARTVERAGAQSAIPWADEVPA